MSNPADTNLTRATLALLDHLSEGCQIIDRDFRYLYVNQAAARHGRSTPQDLVGRTMMEAYPGIDHSPMFPSIRRGLQGGAPERLENEFVYADGSAASFDLRILPVAEGVAILSLDITKRKQAEQMAQHTNRALAALTRSGSAVAGESGDSRVTRDIAWAVIERNIGRLVTRERDPQVLITEACRLLAESCDYAAAAIVTCRGEWLLGSAGSGGEPRVECLRQMVRNQVLSDCAERALNEPHREVLRTHCGTCPRHLAPSEPQDAPNALTVRLKSEGEVYGTLLVVRHPGSVAQEDELSTLREIASDIAFALRSMELEAERHQVVQQLKTTHDRLGAIMRASPAAIYAVDPDGIVLSWNEGAERLFGWSASEAIGASLPPAPAARQAECAELRLRVLHGESVTALDTERLRKDATVAWLSLSAAPLYDASGTAVGITFVAIDIAPRIRAERERELVVSFLRLTNGARTTTELVDQAAAFFKVGLEFEGAAVHLRDAQHRRPLWAPDALEGSASDDSWFFPQAGAGTKGACCSALPNDDGRCDQTDNPESSLPQASSYCANSAAELQSRPPPQNDLTSQSVGALANGLESIGIFPLQFGQHCLGALQLSDSRPGRFTPDTITVTERLTGRLAIALAKTLAEERLASSEARYRELVSSLQDVVFSLDAEGTVLYVSPAITRVYGYPPEEVVGRHFSELVHPDDYEALARSFARTLQGIVAPHEFRGIDKLGRIHHLRSSSRVHLLEGKPVSVAGVIMDVTDLHRAETAERQSEQRYRSLFERASVGLAHCQMVYEDEQPVDLRILVANPAFERITSLQGVAGKQLSKLVPGILEKTPRLLELCNLAVHDGETRHSEIHIEPLDQWFDISVYSPHEGQFLLILDDITERKRAEARLVEFNNRLEWLAQVVQALSQAHDIATIVPLVRQAAAALVGADGASFVLRDGDQFHSSEGPSSVPTQGAEYADYVCAWTMLHREPLVVADTTKDPRFDPASFDSTLVRSVLAVPLRAHQPVGAICVHWEAAHAATPEDVRILQALADATSVAIENAHALTEIEESQARTRAIYAHLPGPTFVWKRQGDTFVLADFNRAAEASGRGTVNLLGKTPDQLPYPMPYLGEDLESCHRNRSATRRELECNVPDTLERRRVVMSCGFVPSDMVIAHVEDITDQRKLEDRLRMSQRLEAVGRLAGGMAHDFNNLLSVILSYAGLVFDALQQDDPVREDIQEIQRAARRGAVLIQQLLAFSRKQVLNPKVLDLNGVVTGMEGMLRRLLGEDIELSTRLCDTLGSVTADASQLEQIIMNLAVNARDAMAQGGTLFVETENRDLDEGYAAQHVAVKPGRYVMLAVSDTGAGMDDVTREHIFEPFFTTKEKGKGTGLGLATVYGIVKQSGGNIWAYSEPGRGSTFKLYLPRVDTKPEGIRRAQSPKVTTGSETVLVVEDEHMVRGIAERILRAAGYTVLSAAGAEAALFVSGQHRGIIHLLLTDVIMPQMNGPELAAKLIERSPGLKVLYMSGYTDTAISQKGILSPNTDFLSKPFSARELTRRVREALDRP